MPVDCDAFRAAWVSTVLNLDWPSRASAEIPDDARRAQVQKDELLRILDRARELGLNAVILQVSPTADAFYRSDRQPWSAWLTGRLGKDPGFDPLRFAIAEAHKRGLKLHAWLNPYRVAMDASAESRRALADTPAGAPKSVYRIHPEWVGVAAGRLVLDPGVPAARRWIGEIAAEVVRKYDVDGVQFDDYFYYETPTSPLDDAATFRRYGAGFKSKADWRRHNTTLLVEDIHRRIKAIKPHVRFGVSPGGVWRNRIDDPRGSATQAGKTNYDGDFADTRRWVKEGVVDYIAPQVYWSFGRKAAPYGEIVRWWADTVKGTKTDLYIGMALYRAGEATASEPDWAAEGGLTEIRRQLDLNDRMPEVKGGVLFRADYLLRPALKSVTDHLKRRWAACRSGS